MSIIHDALKKIETNNSIQPDFKFKKEIKFKARDYLFFAVIAVLGFFATKAIFVFIKHAVEDNSLAIEKPFVTVKKTPPVKKPVVIKESPVVKKPVVKEPPAVVKEDIPVLTKAAPAAAEAPQPPQFVLNGIILSNEVNYALINSRIVEAGDTIEGATVVRINQRAVELKTRDSKTIILSPKKD